MKYPGKTAVAKIQVRSKKKVKYGDKNGNKNEGLRDFAQTGLASDMKSPLWSIRELVQNDRNEDVRRRTVGVKVI